MKSYPKKDQAIIFTALDNSKLKDYLFAVGDIVTPKAIVAASRISRNRICIYLDSKATADNFIEKSGGIKINDQFIPAKKLINPTRKIIISNIHPSVPDTIISELLEENDLKLASTIKTLHVRLDDTDLYNHVSTFRRFVYVYDYDNFKMPESIRASFEGEFFRIFLTDDSLRCYLCKQNGHIASTCDYNFDNQNMNVDDDEEPEEQNEPSSHAIIRSQENITLSDPNTDRTAAQKRALSSNSSVTSHSTNLEILPQSSSPPFENNSSLSPPSNEQPSPRPSNPPEAPKPKKQKKLKITDEKPISITTEPPPNEPHKTTNENVSINQLLNSIRANIDTNHQNKTYPLSYSNFALMMDIVKSQQDPLPRVKEFTDDIAGVIRMLEDNYPKLENRSIKIRFSKLKKKLSLENDSNDESS